MMSHNYTQQQEVWLKVKATSLLAPWWTRWFQKGEQLQQRLSCLVVNYQMNNKTL